MQEVRAVYVNEYNAAQQQRLREEQTVLTPTDTVPEVTQAWPSSTGVIVPLAAVIGLLVSGVAVALRPVGWNWQRAGH